MPPESPFIVKSTGTPAPRHSPAFRPTRFRRSDPYLIIPPPFYPPRPGPHLPSSPPPFPPSLLPLSTPFPVFSPSFIQPLLPSPTFPALCCTSRPARSSSCPSSLLPRPRPQPSLIVFVHPIRVVNPPHDEIVPPVWSVPSGPADRQSHLPHFAPLHRHSPPPRAPRQHRLAVNFPSQPFHLSPVVVDP